MARAPAPTPTTPPAAVPNPVEAARRQQTILLRVLRIGFLVLILTVTLLNIILVGESAGEDGLSVQLATRWWIPLFFAVVLAGLFLAADLLIPNKKIQTIGGILLGLVTGLVATVAAGFVIDLVASTWDFADTRVVATAKVLLGIGLCYLGIATVLQTQDDFRLVIPYVEFAKQIRGPRPLLLDSSALIDARIADVGETGFIQSPVIVPSFVLAELQLLADSSDGLKRAKGRRGLEVIGRLQRSPLIDLSFDETPVPGKAVDQMLVELAARTPGTLVTGDTALTRIAELRDVPTLNLNDLANALKPAVVPGEELSVKLVKPGEHAGQGVGYLADGTMVVAEDGAGEIGRRVTLEVRTSLQTSAGRMIFGRVRRPEGVAAPDAAPAERAEPEPEAVASQEPAALPDPPSPERRGPFPPAPPRKTLRPRSPRR